MGTVVQINALLSGKQKMGWKELQRDSSKHNVPKGVSQYEYLKGLGSKLEGDARQVWILIWKNGKGGEKNPKPKHRLAKER